MTQPPGSDARVSLANLGGILRGNITFTKRQRERDKAERKKEKAAKREERRVSATDQPEVPPGVDLDIAHIVPGPQPIEEDDQDV